MGRFRSVLPKSIPKRMAISAAPKVGRKRAKYWLTKEMRMLTARPGRIPSNSFLIAFIFMSDEPSNIIAVQ